MRFDALTLQARAVIEAAPQLKKLKDASKGVEAMFAKQLISEMQKGTKLFGEGQAGSIYGDMFNEAIARQVAERGALGLADLMVSTGSQRLIAEAMAKVRAQQISTSSLPQGEPKNPS